MSAAAVIQELRARLGAFDSPFQREAFPYSRLASGLPRGILAELTGPGKTESVVQLLAENPALRVAWVEEKFSLLPSAFLQRQASLAKIFFVEGASHSAWAASAILRSQLFPIVVYNAPYDCERALRRFQLLAERSRSTMILLGHKALEERAWPIRLSLVAAGGGPLTVVKGR